MCQGPDPKTQFVISSQNLSSSFQLYSHTDVDRWDFYLRRHKTLFPFEFRKKLHQMSLPLARYQRNKIFDPQQGISQNNLIVPALSSKKVMLFSTATVWFDFSLWWIIFCVSRIILDRDRSLVIRLSSPPQLDTRLRGHYPLILIMWEYKCTSVQVTITHDIHITPAGPAHGQSPVLGPGGHLAWRSIYQVISIVLLWPSLVGVIEVTTLGSGHHLWVRSALLKKRMANKLNNYG